MVIECLKYRARLRLCSPLHGANVSSQKGFTLIETLVAFMVMAIVLVVILQVFSGGIRSGRKSNQYLYGTFHARAKMEELLMRDINPGTYSGTFADGYRWRAEAAFVDDGGAADEDVDVEQMAISVNVSWQENERATGIELHSLKLVPSG